MQCCLYVYRIIYLMWSHGIRFPFHTLFFPALFVPYFCNITHTSARAYTHTHTKHIPKQIEFFGERLWFFGFSHQTRISAIQHSIWKHPKRMVTNCGSFISFTLFHEMWFRWPWPLFSFFGFHLNSPVSRNQDKCLSLCRLCSISSVPVHFSRLSCSRITLYGFLSVLVIFVVVQFTICAGLFFFIRLAY